MSYHLIYTNRFQKNLRVLRKSGQKSSVEYAEHVIHLLQEADTNPDARMELGEKWYDHPLTGNLAGYRELHILRDVLLIYRRNTSNKVIELYAIVNHEELRKMK